MAKGPSDESSAPARGSAEPQKLEPTRKDSGIKGLVADLLSDPRSIDKLAGRGKTATDGVFAYIDGKVRDLAVELRREMRDTRKEMEALHKAERRRYRSHLIYQWVTIAAAAVYAIVRNYL